TEDPNAIINDIVSGIKDKPYEVEPDRRKAILTALSMAKAGDMVVIAGKGHEDYQDINGVKHHFDDREVAREGLIFLGKNQR
ncbi:MAG: UDP-N-acetylmuramoyl-L-alanyl-D-glutamate--2,6-diaminopimelate ligase, partial [Bacillota bacterium]